MPRSIRTVPVLLIALLSASAQADSPWEGAPPPAESADESADAYAPATVLDDRLDVTIDAGGRLKEKRSWTVRIEDPKRVTAGLIAPDGLDGAENNGAQVFDRLLVVPKDAAAGTTYTLVSTRTQANGPWSGVYTTAPDLPVVHAQVTIKSASPYLAVWTDPRANAEFSRDAGRVATASWEGLEPPQQAEVVWTTWKDWLQAGERINTAVDAKVVTDKSSLGRAMGADLSGISVALVAERVYQQVHYAEDKRERWQDAKGYAEIVNDGQGNAVDRGVVLMSVLRAAGYDARPALARPAATSGAAPLSVPAPALMDHVAVAVVLPGRIVWIDPASDRIAIPDLPASLYGASVWIPGDLPFEMPNPGVVDGLVSVTGQVQIAPSGEATWSATITASGVAQEMLRTLLAPLDEPGRQEALRRLAIVGHPENDRFAMDASGIEDPYRPLRIGIQGHEPHTAKPFGDAGLDATIPPLIGPALASWLPPRILVREELAITPPNGLQPVSTTSVAPSFDAEANLTRSWRREASKLVLITEADRPERDMSPGQEADSEAYLHSQAILGPQVLLLPPPTPDVVRSLRAASTGRPPAEVAVLEALLWWTNNNQPKKAEKALNRALSLDAPSVAGFVAKHGTADTRPWEALWRGAPNDTIRLQAAAGLEAQGEAREAWLKYAMLANNADPAIRVPALLGQERLEGDTPKADDGIAGAAWKPHADLLTAADAAGKTIPGASADGDPRVLARLARVALDEGRDADAETLLQKAVAQKSEPGTKVLLAWASAGSGLAINDVVEQIDAAVAEAPFDAEVTGYASRAMAKVGRLDRAEHYAVSAARLAFDDPKRWRDVVDPALAAGDLGTAFFAAKRASDLDPKDPIAGDQLALTATLAGDQEAALAGAARSGKAAPTVKWPPTVQDLVPITPENALLAVLQYHDAAVIKDASLLSLRAQLRLDAGLLDGAARDGSLLASRHGQPRGTAILFAATAGRLWSTAILEALETAAKQDATANATRMEYRLITGSGDPTADARAQRDDPRSQIVLRAYSQPEQLAAEVPGWPQDLVDPVVRVPTGFKANKALSGAKGVVAFSDPERAISVVRAARPTGSLPPPLAQLYTPATPAIRSLVGGGQLLRLDGGPIPLYAAIRVDGEQEVTGLGYTPEAAVTALLAGSAH
jgi:hypothetical protein